MPEPKIKPGSQTSEYDRAKSGGAWGGVAMTLGTLLSIGSVVAQAFDVGSTAGIIAGAVIASAGIFQKMLTDLGYIKSRTDIKAKRD